MHDKDIKKAALELIKQHDHLTWAELAYQATLKASIEQGVTEAREGRLISQQEVEREFSIVK